MKRGTFAALAVGRSVDAFPGSKIKIALEKIKNKEGKKLN